MTEGEVGLGQFGCRRVKGQLSAGHPVAVTQNRRRVDGRTAKVQIHVSVDVDEVTAERKAANVVIEGKVARMRGDYQRSIDFAIQDKLLLQLI